MLAKKKKREGGRPAPSCHHGGDIKLLQKKVVEAACCSGDAAEGGASLAAEEDPQILQIPLESVGEDLGKKLQETFWEASDLQLLNWSGEMGLNRTNTFRSRWLKSFSVAVDGPINQGLWPRGVAPPRGQEASDVRWPAAPPRGQEATPPVDDL